VAHRVVDLLEAVEVDQHERRERALVAGAGQCPRTLLVQLGAIREAGQRVVRGLMAQAARGARHDPEQPGPQQQQAAAQRDEQRPRVGGDGARGGLVGHVALEHAAADRHVDLEEAPLGAELVGVGLDVGLDLARQRRADVVVARRVLADERAVVGPHDAPAVVVELAPQQAARGEPAVERGDPLPRERPAVGLPALQLAGDADVRDGDRQVPGVVERAPLDARVQDRPERDAQDGGDQEADDAERLQQGETRNADPHGIGVGGPRDPLKRLLQGRTHVRHERRGALAPHGMQGILRSAAAPRPSRTVRRWHRAASNRWRSRAVRR
jgi:hypothetical protein